MFPTFKPLNQRSDLNFTRRSGVETLSHEGSKAQRRKFMELGYNLLNPLNLLNLLNIFFDANFLKHGVTKAQRHEEENLWKLVTTF